MHVSVSAHRRCVGPTMAVTVKRNPDWLEDHILDCKIRSLGSSHELAKSYWARGDLENARKVLCEITCNGMRAVGYKLGRYGVAKVKLTQEIRYVSPETLATLSDWCQVLLESGNAFHIECAVPLYRVAAEFFSFNLGADHEDTLTIKHGWADALKAHGKLEEAELLHREVLEARNNTLGRMHADTISSKRSLVELLEAKGDEHELQRELEQEVEQLTREVVSQRLMEQVDYDSVMEYKEKDENRPSHLQLDFDEDENPVLEHFTYVDEIFCVGCNNCWSVAENTFFMNNGVARVFSQGGDSPDLIAEAIDTCPVNCIYYVSLEDLIVLETEREIHGDVSVDHSGLRFANRNIAEKSQRKAETNIKMGKHGLDQQLISQQDKLETKRKDRVASATSQAVKNLEMQRKIDLLFDFQKGFAVKNRFADLENVEES